MIDKPKEYTDIFPARDYFGELEDDSEFKIQPKRIHKPETSHKNGKYTGMQFGNWLIGKVANPKQSKYWCSCDCGEVQIKNVHNVRHRRSKCLRCRKLDKKGKDWFLKG